VAILLNLVKSNVIALPYESYFSPVHIDNLDMDLRKVTGMTSKMTK